MRQGLLLVQPLDTEPDSSLWQPEAEHDVGVGLVIQSHVADIPEAATVLYKTYAGLTIKNIGTLLAECDVLAILE